MEGLLYMLLLFSFLSLILGSNHLLSVMINFEVLVVGGVLGLCFYWMGGEMSEVLLLFYLLMGVVEGVLGLSLIILMMRSSGMDYFLMKLLLT
uniref:NADH dehydrogenase subunit 4L n=1 Tax=Pauropus longiramus TaxID=933850 RepID=G9BG48_9MYRI|nr:NADH dehydrogenase subunit 4L [Pauropus longiramus]ADT63086.1 NADH dehydrogenase subunit 4L [Pauropus longiramus]